jgi:hypothetical protein
MGKSMTTEFDMGGLSFARLQIWAFLKLKTINKSNRKQEMSVYHLSQIELEEWSLLINRKKTAVSSPNAINRKENKNCLEFTETCPSSRCPFAALSLSFSLSLPPPLFD